MGAGWIYNSSLSSQLLTCNSLICKLRELAGKHIQKYVCDLNSGQADRMWFIMVFIELPYI